jgi:hypothetical protein
MLMLASTFRSHRSLSTILSTALLGMMIGGLGSGSSKAFAQAAAPAETQQRIRELEQRVKIIELENEALARRVQLEIDRSTRVLDDMDKRLHVVETHAAAPVESAGKAADKIGMAEDPCRYPYIHVAPGIMRIRPGCESAGGQCDAPERVDARGIRTVLPGCQQVIDETGGSCEPPYFIDAGGMKRFKPACM